MTPTRLISCSMDRIPEKTRKRYIIICNIFTFLMHISCVNVLESLVHIIPNMTNDCSQNLLIFHIPVKYIYIFFLSKYYVTFISTYRKVSCWQCLPCFGLSIGKGSPSFQKKYMNVNQTTHEKSNLCFCTVKEQKTGRVHKQSLTNLKE